MCVLKEAKQSAYGIKKWSGLAAWRRCAQRMLYNMDPSKIMSCPLG